MVFAVSAASSALIWQESSRQLAVVVAGDAVLHEGDGTSFPIISQGQLREGQTVELYKRRGEWLQVRNENGMLGWLPSASVEAI